ncbi:potassium-transporting ATPase subunit KdpB [bacterium]|nr:potassium-transporting ATPase subunit KdpB [bacterium]
MASLLSNKIVSAALIGSFKKLDPRVQLKNPVMFCVLIGAVYTTLACILGDNGSSSRAFNVQISGWLWLTVFFANFAESIAEGRGKAQADSLKKSRKDVEARKIHSISFSDSFNIIPAADLRKDDLVIVWTNDTIPGDGEVVLGAATVDESAITGESAPVVREAGGDRSSVTAGTVVLSDKLIIRITRNPGETFLDQMISMVEGAKRQKTPNELALSILLAAMTIIFLFVCVTLKGFSDFAIEVGGNNSPVSVTILVALLVCLIPTTIGGLLSAIGIAGMERLVRKNVIALSGRAVEAAGDIDVLLLDKTGTITLGNRQAVAFYPAEGKMVKEVAHAALTSSLSDETPEGRSIVKLASDSYAVNATKIDPKAGTIIPFTAETRMSGFDTEGNRYRKGAADAIKRLVGGISSAVQEIVDSIAKKGGTPLVVALNEDVVGVIELKDIVKPGIKARFSELRSMGIKTVMITGDNPLTAASIAAEAGVDDFLAEATPEAKLNLIKKYQNGGRLVAMTGDGTNDAPALAQADVAVAMNSGTQAAKEAANMVDLDSNPTKLIEVVETGKQLLMTRGALTTFSISNDVAKYFAIIPAAFAGIYPQLQILNVMGLASPESATLSAIIFNALIIIFLIPLAMKGVVYRPVGAAEVLRRHILIYGVGGLIVPFIGIKLVDLCIVAIGLV